MILEVTATHTQNYKKVAQEIKEVIDTKHINKVEARKLREALLAKQAK